MFIYKLVVLVILSLFPEYLVRFLFLLTPKNNTNAPCIRFYSAMFYRNRAIPPGQFPPDNCPLDNYAPENCHLGQLPQTNAT